jgi:general secretion pathway protein D
MPSYGQLRSGGECQPAPGTPFAKPVNLSFPETIKAHDVYNALSKASGIKILFDGNLSNPSLQLHHQAETALGWLQLVTFSAQHFYKVTSNGEVIVADDTPQKRREHEELVIRTFVLENISCPDADKMLRSMIETRRVSTNSEKRTVTIRDTVDKVRIAEELLKVIDRPSAEVEVVVTMLAIEADRLRQLWKKQGYGHGAPSRISAEELQQLTEAGAQLIANPTLNVFEGSKGNLFMGDEVPIPMKTAGPSPEGLGSGETTYSYRRVGLSLTVTPQVHSGSDEVTVELAMELTGTGADTSKTGAMQPPPFSSRQLSSEARLGSGETWLLADVARLGSSDAAGVTSLPLLMSQDGQRTERQLVIALSPRITRKAQYSAEDLAPLAVGTESTIRFPCASR